MLSKQLTKRYFSQWLEKRLASVPASKTVALLVDEDEVKNQSLACLSHVHSSKEFRQDLALQKSAWIYTNDAAMRRCLLIQHKLPKGKDDQSEEDRQIAEMKAMRELAVHTVGKLQALKVSDVEVIASSKIKADSLGTFINSFDLSNYEYKEKGDVEDEKKDEEDDTEEVDERTKRKEKLLDNFTVSHEEDLEKNENCVYNRITAEATKYARDLANTRGTQADPAWMEQ